MSKNNSKRPSRAPSGTTTPAIREALVPVETVLGLNLGQSFSSISVINKEGLADCIANDDGERQVASAVSFNGEEEYTGVPARVQLVRNAQNTILNFRNLLGKTYDEVKDVVQPYNSAPIVNSAGSPAFTVLVNNVPTTFTAHQITVRYLSVLLSYATDFLGRKITGAVLAVPTHFTPVQVDALVKAAEEAGIKVLQTINEAAAGLTAYSSTLLKETTSSLPVDRNVVVVDVGGTSTSVTVVAVRDGLYVPLANVYDGELGGDLFDAQLMSWFGKEFTKKTKIALPATEHRALMKLRLAVEVTKKSLSASNTAPCSVESLAEGMDFHGTVNRTRFDLLSSAVYAKISQRVGEALAKSGLDSIQISELVLLGGSTKLPALSEKLSYLFPESTTLTTQIEADEVIAKGTALQALSLLSTYSIDTPGSADLRTRATKDASLLSPATLSSPIGLLIPATPADSLSAIDGSLFVVLLDQSTPLPARRIIDVDVAAGATEVILNLAEGTHEVAISQPKPAPAKSLLSRASAALTGGANADEEEDDEEEEIKTSRVKKTKALGEVIVRVETSGAGKGKRADKVRITIEVNAVGGGSVVAVQLREGAVESRAEF